MYANFTKKIIGEKKIAISVVIHLKEGNISAANFEKYLQYEIWLRPKHSFLCKMEPLDEIETLHQNKGALFSSNQSSRERLLHFHVKSTCQCIYKVFAYTTGCRLKNGYSKLGDTVN